MPCCIVFMQAYNIKQQPCKDIFETGRAREIEKENSQGHYNTTEFVHFFRGRGKEKGVKIEKLIMEA